MGSQFIHPSIHPSSIVYYAEAAIKNNKAHNLKCEDVDSDDGVSRLRTRVSF